MSASPDSKVHEAYMGPTWGWQDPGGTHVGPINVVIRGYQTATLSQTCTWTGRMLSLLLLLLLLLFPKSGPVDGRLVFVLTKWTRARMRIRYIYIYIYIYIWCVDKCIPINSVGLWCVSVIYAPLFLSVKTFRGIFSTTYLFKRYLNSVSLCAVSTCTMLISK